MHKNDISFNAGFTLVTGTTGDHCMHRITITPSDRVTDAMRNDLLSDWLTGSATFRVATRTDFKYIA